jgi:hypothetical protein
MPRTGPLVPIFDPGRKRGQVRVGTQASGTYTPPAPPFSLSLGGGTANPACICRYLDDYLIVGCANQVAGTGSFIHVINITDPEVPFIEGTAAPDTDLISLRGVCVVGDHAFTVSGSSTSLPQIGSWDLSDVSNPVLDDKLTTNETFRSVCVLANSSTYIACSRLLGDEFRIINISDPTNITNPESLTGNQDYLQGILDMWPVGDYIICNTATDLGTPCIVTVNVANPLNISVVGGGASASNKLFQAHAGQFANGDMLVEGTYAYVVANAANGGVHLTVLDVTDPTNITEVGYTFNDVVTPSDATPQILAKEPGSNTIYILDTQRIHKFSVANKSAPVLQESFGPDVTYGSSETSSPHQEAIWAKNRIFRVSNNDVLWSLPLL